MSPSDVTIIIPHLEGRLPNKGLRICLESLKKSKFPTGNIIVAFNGNTSTALAESSVTGCRYLFIPEQGQCKAVNAAAAIVDTPWIMVSNNDMVYPEDWFANLTNEMDSKFLVQSSGEISQMDLSAAPGKIVLADAVVKMDELFCISPQLVEPRPGAPTFVTDFAGGLGGDWNPDRFFRYAAEEHKSHGIRPGFNLPFLIKKEVWDVVGGYDISYDPWGSNSDSDLEYKLKLAGIQPYQNTNCPVYHFSQTSGTFEPQYGSYWGKNWQYFIEKWGFPRTDDGIWEATFTIPAENKFHPWWENFYAR